MVSGAAASSNFWTFSILKPSGNPAEVETHADQAGHRHLPDQRARARVRVSAGFAFGGEHRQSHQKNDSNWHVRKLLGRWFVHWIESRSISTLTSFYQFNNKGAVPGEAADYLS